MEKLIASPLKEGVFCVVTLSHLDELYSPPVQHSSTTKALEKPLFWPLLQPTAIENYSLFESYTSPRLRCFTILL